MTHTIPYTQSEQDKTIANAVNVAYRHCRVGKVTRKSIALSEPLIAPWTPVEPFRWPTPFGLMQSGGYVPVSRSDDVAYLHLPIVTC